VAQLLESCDRSNDCCLCPMSTDPTDVDVNLLAVSFNVHHDLIDELSDDHLAFGGRGRGRAPEAWDVRRERSNARAFLFTDDSWLFCNESIMFLLERLLDRE